MANGSLFTPAAYDMQIQDFFGDYPFSRFVAEHLHRLPLALPNVGESMRAAGDWSCIESCIAAPDADMMLVARGARHEGPMPRDLSSARALCDSGCTLLIKHAERHSAEIAEVAGVFSRTFRAPVDIH